MLPKGLNELFTGDNPVRVMNIYGVPKSGKTTTLNNIVHELYYRGLVKEIQFFSGIENPESFANEMIEQYINTHEALFENIITNNIDKKTHRDGIIIIEEMNRILDTGVPTVFVIEDVENVLALHGKNRKISFKTRTMYTALIDRIQKSNSYLLTTSICHEYGKYIVDVPQICSEVNLITDYDNDGNLFINVTPCVERYQSSIIRNVRKVRTWDEENYFLGDIEDVDK